MNNEDYNYAVRSIPHLNLTVVVPRVPVDKILKSIPSTKALN